MQSMAKGQNLILSKLTTHINSTNFNRSVRTEQIYKLKLNEELLKYEAITTILLHAKHDGNSRGKRHNLGTTTLL